MAPILSHAVDRIGRLRFATKPPQTQLTPSSAIEHEENGVPEASHNRSGSEQPAHDSLENTISSKADSRVSRGRNGLISSRPNSSEPPPANHARRGPGGLPGREPRLVFP